MKKILLIAAALLLVGAGCLQAAAPPVTPAPTATEIRLGEAFTLKTGESRSLQGGLRVTLEAIGDSRCPKGVQCIWAGELSPKLRVELKDASEELTLGTLTKLKADALGYRFSLVAATESEVTLIVTG